MLQRFVNEDNLTESEAAYYLRQLLLAVEYMHSRNVIHLDLKVIHSSYHTVASTAASGFSANSIHPSAMTVQPFETVLVR